MGDRVVAETIAATTIIIAITTTSITTASTSTKERVQSIKIGNTRSNTSKQTLSRDKGIKLGYAAI